MEGAESHLGPRERFAELFALLYAEAGDPPLKRVTGSVVRSGRLDEQGRPVRVTAQRISDWRRGRNVPARFSALAVVLDVLVGLARKSRPTPRVTGLYDLDSWRALWDAALASPASTGRQTEDGDTGDGDEAETDRKPVSGVCPYRGLAPFRQQDADWFFGRERSVAALVGRLADAAKTGGIVMLVGASGAGKSSLVRAGLVPALNRGDLPVTGSSTWPVRLMTPGETPLERLGALIPELAGTLAARPAEEIADTDDTPEDDRFGGSVRSAIEAAAHREGDGQGHDSRLVLVVDQFEEAFTLCRDEEERRAFVRVLHAACTPARPGETPPCLVVVGVRADFYARCLDYPALADGLQDRQMVLGAMRTSELRAAVAAPARAVGLQIGPGLIELMLRDLGTSGGREQGRSGQGAYDAGALPLLSHALLATWQRRQAGKLTIAGYRAAGGIEGAVAATAERAWDDLDAAGKAAARQLLLRLVHVGIDTQDTRRSATRDEVVGQATDRDAAAKALEVLARARLVTLDADSVEITHEALLQAWPRLRDWIDQDRAGIAARQRLDADASTWDDEHRDPALLYRGARLETAQQAALSSELSAVARDFLAASTRNRRRSAWIRRAAVAVVVVCALVAAATAALAIQQRDDAQFGQVVAEAARVGQFDPSLSAELDLVAHGMRPDDQGVAASLISTEDVPLSTPLIGHTGAVYLTSFRPDGKVLATASYDRTVRLWDVTDHSHPKPLGRPLTGYGSWVTSAVFSPDGKVLATAGDDHLVRLWNVADPARPALLGSPVTGHDGTIYLVAFSPDGHTLATADADRTVRLWNVTDPARPTTLAVLTGHTGQVRSIAFSPDGHTLAASGDDTTILMWNVTDPAVPVRIGPALTGHSATVHSLAFSPDGRTLASGSEDHTVRLWNVANPAAAAPIGLPLIGHTSAVWSVEFSPDGRTLASGSADSTARLWNVSNPADASQLGQPLAGHAGGIFAVGFSPDGRYLATGSSDSTVRLWSLPAQVLVGHSTTVDAVFSPDGRILATGSDDDTIRLWNVADPADPHPFGPPVTLSAQVWTLTFSPDGRTLATGDSDSTLRLWNVSNPADPVPDGPPVPLATRYEDQVAFSPNGSILAVSHDDLSLRLWNVRDPAHPVPVGPVLTGHSGYVNSIGFSPDGRTMATGSSDHTVRLWDVAAPDRTHQIGAPIEVGDEVHRVVFAPDGRTIATADEDKTVRLWNVTDPARPTPAGPPLTGSTASLNAVAFSPDGRMIAAGGTDEKVWLWNPADQTSSAEALTGSTGGISSVAFDPNGRYLATTSEDGVVRLWNLDVDTAIRRVCATTGGVLTPAQWQQHIPQMSYQPPCP